MLAEVISTVAPSAKHQSQEKKIMRTKTRLLFVVGLLPILFLGMYLSASATSGFQPAPPAWQDPVGAVGLSKAPPAAPAPYVLPAGPRAPAAGTGLVTVPPDFPAITVTVPASNTAPGYVFVTAFSATSPNAGTYLMMFDDAGQTVYYQKLVNDVVTDFKVQPDGTLSYADGQRGSSVIMDSSYQELGLVRPGNGSFQDGHDLQLLSNPHGASGSAHYLIMAGKYVTVDMSLLVPGGDPQAQVLEQIVQEVDRAGNVYWEWPILDYVPVTATNQSLTTSRIDYSHCNAIEDDSIDADHNVLLSCRHLDAIIKINRSTKQIMWQLGGKGNDFTFVAGPGIAADEPLNFYYQHDIRRLPSGHITLFDNHNAPEPTISRVLEYELDEGSRTARLVRALHHEPDIYASFMGNAQLLPNGNTMVGWGGNRTPSLTEYSANGDVAFEIDFADPLISYRAFRFPWTGRPTWPPALVSQSSSSGITLTFSWNGATDVASYQIYGGNTLALTQLLREQETTGFETSVTLQGADAGYCVYRVVPVDSQGRAGPASAPAFTTDAGAAACGKTVYLPQFTVQ
jgi:hypothetical protein